MKLRLRVRKLEWSVQVVAQVVAQDFVKAADSVVVAKAEVGERLEVEERAAIDQCAISRFVFLNCQIGKSNLFH